MEDKSYRLNTPLCSMPAEEADRLLSAADGCCALLYLYLLRNGSLSGAAHTLRLSETELSAAAERLRSLGLVSACSKLPPPDDEMPEYTAEDIVRRSGEDAGFRGVLAETERIMGRTLSSADTKTLFGIYDHLGLPPEVIMQLLNHCVEECREKYGAGRLPTMRTVEKEAYVWANREIMTLDSAEEYLRTLQERRSVMEQVRRLLGIRDRAFSATERRYIEEWLDLGFTPEAIEIAGDRTVTNTGQLKWAYMNKIILSWESKHLHAPAEIEKGDRPTKPASRAPVPESPRGSDLERLKRAYEKVKNG